MGRIEAWKLGALRPSQFCAHSLYSEIPNRAWPVLESVIECQQFCRNACHCDNLVSKVQDTVRGLVNEGKIVYSSYSRLGLLE